ncbi:MAG: LysR family transcriptional regulator [Sporomusaceae bacterium]|nr:LysR family transcriptional regulator [Sporomusaceae bacterium]
MYVAGIEAFLAIIQTQNLKKAADVLNLTQATVSYRLKALEQELGGVLVERGKGLQRISLTPFGEAFVSIAERWDSLRQDVEKLRAAGPQLTLVIGGSNSLNTYILPPLYRALIQYRPRIQLQFRTQHSLELWDMIERREIDVGFVKMERTVPNIDVEPFYVDQSVLIRPATPHGGELLPLHPLQLHAADEIYFNWGPDFEIWHSRWWDPLRPACIPVDNAGLIFSLMRSPEQWAVVPKSVADTFVKTGQFAIQQLIEPPPERVCYKIMHRHGRPAARKSLLVLERYMTELFGNNRT